MACLILTILTTLWAGQTAPPSPTPAPPLRIIANAPSNAEIVCALGAGELLVGVSTYVTYPESLRQLPRVGGLDDPDLEAILALRPDLVLQRGHNEHVAALCAKHGIRMYSDRTDSLPTLYTTITEIGQLISRPTQAQELVESIHNRLAAVSREAPKRRPRVLLALRSPDRLTPLTTVGKPSYLHELIEIAGGTNVFGDLTTAYPEVSLEDVIAREPEIIIDAMPGADMRPEQIQRAVEQWSVLRTLPAVKNAAIHLLTEDYVLTPSPRVVLVAERLHEIVRSEGPARDE